MISTVFEWIFVGAARRIVEAYPEWIAQGGVTPIEAFELLVTERGRRARYFAREILHGWTAAQAELSARPVAC